MGVRESSIPMSYTTGDSRFDSYDIEGCYSAYVFLLLLIAL